MKTSGYEEGVVFNKAIRYSTLSRTSGTLSRTSGTLPVNPVTLRKVPQNRMDKKGTAN